MKIFSNEEIQNISRYTVETEGISSMELINRVARGVASEICNRWSPDTPTVVFAGPGDNGADALAVAVKLIENGFDPEIYLFNVGGNTLSADCKRIRNRMKEIPELNFNEVVINFGMPELTPNHLVVDGLFGLGLNKPLEGGFRILVQRINDSGASVVSIDIPSGLNADNNEGQIFRDIIHADLTMAIQAPHRSFFNPETAELVGEWKVVDVGMSRKCMNEIVPDYFLIEAVDVRRRLRKRMPFCSKADFGSAAIVAGSYGMMGAALLATQGALRSGVGKVTTISPRCGFNIIQQGAPEAMFQADHHDIITTNVVLKSDYSALAIGPGLGTHDMTVDAVDQFVSGAKKPIVVDADALNCIAKRPSILYKLPVLSILTPHAGEFDRLFGAQKSHEARVAKALEMAYTYNIFIVLKGRFTSVIYPDGHRVCINSSGTPAMATAGSGDVLTGVIAGFLAQGYRPEIATLMGVYIHGLAGEIAEKQSGLYGVTAGDIARNIGLAIQHIFDNDR